MSYRLVLAVSGSVCAALIALSGCSAGTPRSPAATPTATARPSSPVISSTVTSPAATGPPSAASPRAGSLTVNISGLPSHPALALGRAPLQFTVTVRNATARTYRDITPLVSIGHCTCNNSPAAPAPDGTLAEFDPVTGNWRSVFYDPEGTGMDYILANVIQQPAFTLDAGATASFTFRMGFSAQQGLSLHAGQTAIDVTVLQLPARTWIGNRPAGASQSPFSPSDCGAIRHGPDGSSAPPAVPRLRPSAWQPPYRTRSAGARSSRPGISGRART